MIVILLIIIVVILLFGSGLIFGAAGLVVVAGYAVAPWFFAMLAIMIVARLLAGFANSRRKDQEVQRSRERRKEAHVQTVAALKAEEARKEADMLARGRAEYERTFGPIEQREARLLEARRKRSTKRR